MIFHAFQADIVDTAVKGTLNVLKSCVKSPSVKRVIYTSSMAAVMCNEKPLTPNTVVDETWFSDPAFCGKTKNWYALSKNLAESAAWKFAEENGIDLVTLNSGITIGEQSYPSPYKLIDVKDVAHAHIQALELPSASGRYCIVESIRSSTETLEILQQLFPTLHLPTKLEDDKPNEPTYKVSRKKAESLGINFISWEIINHYVSKEYKLTNSVLTGLLMVTDSQVFSIDEPVQGSMEDDAVCYVV
ncbi:hypothetical protein QYF36_000003 [Acer negundo]|nr:hypothetical protein QYF36_000003 [Acer negundo]